MRSGKWPNLIMHVRTVCLFLMLEGVVLVFLVGDVVGSAPKPFAPDVVDRPGVFIEKWEGIDSNAIQKLLDDSRFPYLPTWRGYSLNFAQPTDWGNNFGTRIRTYFVPKTSGYHKFYLACDNEARLYLSNNENPDHKSEIAKATHYTSPLTYNDYQEQRSFPVLLQKGHYYYMETLMKEGFSDDNLDVAVKTPDNKMHAPITSDFLWTSVYHHQESSNFTSHYNLLKIAAKAGAKAGYQSGITAAQISGAKAGKRAGAAAGRELGAEGGAEAGAKIAKEVITKTVELALRAYGNRRHGHNHVINLYTNRDGKNSLIITNPSSMMGQNSGKTDPSSTMKQNSGKTDPSSTIEQKSGKTDPSSTSGNTDPSLMTGKTGTHSINGKTDPNTTSGKTNSSGAETTGGNGINSAKVDPQGGSVEGTSSSIGSQGGATTSGSTSSGGSGSTSGSSTSGFTSNSISVASLGTQSKLFPGSKTQAETVITPLLPVDQGQRVTPSGFLNPNYESNLAALNFFQFVLQPKPGNDLYDLANKNTNSIGFARKVVIGAYYKIKSQSLPDFQNFEKLNMCFQSVESRMKFTAHCHVFKITKGFFSTTFKKMSVSFESACIPGYYIGVKNYKIYLMKEEPTSIFRKAATFSLFRTVLYPQALQIMPVQHNYWFFCQEKMISYDRSDIKLRFSNTDDTYISKCSFYFQPLQKVDNPLQNCKNVLEFPNPSIKDHNFPDENSAYSAVKPAKAITRKEPCIALNFINKARIPFKIQTNINDDPYLIRSGDFKFKTIVKTPDLHQLVIIKAKDLQDRDTVLLSGGQEISVAPRTNCDDDDDYLDVTVTSKPGMNPENAKKPKKEKTKELTPVHYHYHYHPPVAPPTPPPPPPSPPPPPPVCSPVCTSTPVCPSTCSTPCCKRDTPVYVEAKSKIAKANDAAV